jgi:hypothetical protein
MDHVVWLDGLAWIEGRAYAGRTIGPCLDVQSRGRLLEDYQDLTGVGREGFWRGDMVSRDRCNVRWIGEIL